MQYHGMRSIIARGSNGLTYTIIEADSFSGLSMTPVSGDLTCDAGPVICIARDTYEIWLSGARGPSKVIATAQRSSVS